MRLDEKALRNPYSLYNFRHSTGCISPVGTTSMAGQAAAAAEDHEGSDSNSVILGGGAVAVSRTSMDVAATASTSSNEQINHSFSLQYKGVMRQHNGHWGAQIYAHGRRIWLGTFLTEQAAAGAYDMAAMKLHRQAESPRNFPASSSSSRSINAKEHEFQAMHSTEEVLDMHRTGTYRSRLAQFRMNNGSAVATPRRPSCHVEAGSHAAWHEMFVKELTPSDVGKLNRLVIPKKYATQYFPQTVAEEVTVEFVDREGHTWRFRYCYWKSSQSYVFTKGWNKFVKAKRLQAKDAVRFYRCEERSQRRSYFLIDIIRHNDGSSVFQANTSNSAAVGLELSIKMNKYDDHHHGNYSDGGFENDDGVHMHLNFEPKREVEEETERPRETKRLKLFGEWIN